MRATTIPSVGRLVVAKVVGFVSEKGGVGKTTSVYHIGVALQRFHNFRVLVLDTDYQRGGLTCRLVPELLEHFRAGEIADTTLYHTFRALYTATDPLPVLTIRKTDSNVDVTCADPRLNSVSVDKMPAPRNLRHGNQMLMRHLMLVREAIEPVLDEYDYILIDSHPDLHDLEKAVICASDYVVSPVKLDQQSAVGVPSTVEAINDVNDDVQIASGLIAEAQQFTPTRFVGAIGMMCREYGESLKYSEQVIFNRLSQTTGMFESYVTEGDGLRLAAQNSCTVYDISTPNAEKQSEHFRAVTQEFIGHVI